MYKFLIIVLLFSIHPLKAQKYPLGYKKYFETSINKEKINNKFIFSDNTNSTVSNNIWYLEEKYDTSVNSNTIIIPPALSVIENHIFGDFIADLNLKITSTEHDSSSGVYFVIGLRDSSNYYFIQVNNNGASFYKMYKNNISLINKDSSFTLTSQYWQRLRISRNILKRTIDIETRNQKVTFTDPNLVMGYLGLGISSYKLALKQFVVWAPTAISKPSTLFVR
jgi:hypothetical protein